MSARCGPCIPTCPYPGLEAKPGGLPCNVEPMGGCSQQRWVLLQLPQLPTVRKPGAGGSGEGSGSGTRGVRRGWRCRPPQAAQGERGPPCPGPNLMNSSSLWLVNESFGGSKSAFLKLGLNQRKKGTCSD